MVQKSRIIKGYTVRNFSSTLIPFHLLTLPVGTPRALLCVLPEVVYRHTSQHRYYLLTLAPIFFFLYIFEALSILAYKELLHPFVDLCNIHLYAYTLIYITSPLKVDS